MADLDPLDRFLLEYEARSAGEPRQRIADLWAEARRRLYFDALLSARVKTVAGVLREERRTAGGRWDARDEEIAGAAAALALVIAERLTGQPADRRTPLEVLAGVLAPALLGLTGPLPRTVGGGWQDAEVLARRLLESLEAAGWEVFWRADRFATIADGGRRVRIPTRGRCRTCLLDVERAVEVNDGEVLIDHWRHVDSRAPHRDDAITDVVES